MKYKAAVLEDVGKFKVGDEKDSWAGITKFKLGFVPSSKQGKYEEYVGAWDLIFRKLEYRFLMWGRKLKSIIK